MRQILGNFNADTIAAGVLFILFTDVESISESTP